MFVISLNELSVFTIVGGDGSEPMVTLIPDDPIGAREGDLLEVVEWTTGIFIGTIIREWKTGDGTQVIQAVETSTSSSGCDFVDGGRLIHNVEAAKKNMSDCEWKKVMSRLKEL